jgi:hypothetical protein
MGHGNIMGISWEYYRNIMGISWEYHGNIIGKFIYLKKNWVQHRSSRRPLDTWVRTVENGGNKKLSSSWDIIGKSFGIYNHIIYIERESSLSGYINYSNSLT